MAQRRMFSKDITGADAFIEMPASSQLLYFHLGMEADDDGFIGSPKKISRMIGSGEDDLKILIAKRFVLSFNSGVVVIKHWKLNNYIQSDRYHETKYLDEKKALITKENGSYTECIQDCHKMDTQVRLGKARASQDKSIIATEVAEKIPINHLIKLFEPINPSYEKIYRNKTQRSALERLFKKHGEDNVSGLIKYLKIMNEDRYAKGKSITPLELENNLAHINNHYKANKPKLIHL